MPGGKCGQCSEQYPCHGVLWGTHTFKPEPGPSKCTCDTAPVQDCPDHGIAVSNARQNEYWRRIGGHD